MKKFFSLSVLVTQNGYDSLTAIFVVGGNWRTLRLRKLNEGESEEIEGRKNTSRAALQENFNLQRQAGQGQDGWLIRTYSSYMKTRLPIVRKA